MQPLDTLSFLPGDLYVFSPIDTESPEQSLLGIYDCHDPAGCIRLEAASNDFTTFQQQVRLTDRYRFARLATRDELRDFAYNMGWSRQ